MTFFLFILSIAVVLAQPILAAEQTAILTDSRDGKKSVPRTERDGQDGWKLGKLDGVSLADVVTTFVDDRDGKKYKAVRIGTQVWMAENLNYDAKGSVCYDNKPAYCEKYGRLYNWETANKACPSGWKLPSISEWNELNKAVGGFEVAGEKLKSKSGWDYKGKSDNGTDEFGFSVLPGGFGIPDGSFADVGNDGGLWSTSELNSDEAYLRDMNFDEQGLYWGSYAKSYLHSVRCL